MKAALRVAGPLCTSVLLFLGGCPRVAQSSYLGSYDREINRATKAIKTARDNFQRSEAYAK